MSRLGEIRHTVAIGCQGALVGRMFGVRAVAPLAPLSHRLLFMAGTSSIVLAVALTKGGTGKTTTAANLAVEVAALLQAEGASRRRVVAIDADPQSQLAGVLGANPERTRTSGGLSAVLAATEDARSTAAVAALVRDVRPGLDMCPAGASLATESARLGADPAAGLLAVGDAVMALAEAAVGEGGAPLVIVDVPPGWGPLVLGVLAASDAVLAPVSLQPLALQALGTFVGHLGGVQKTRERFGGERLPVLAQIVPTMYDARPIAHGQVLEAIRAAASGIDRGDGKPPLVAAPVPQSVRVQEAAALGRTVREHARAEHGAAKAYAALAAAVVTDMSL